MLELLDIAGTELRVSEMALGAMLWGTGATVEESLRLYDVYRGAGGNVFDTAHVYAAWRPDGLGVSERTLGQVIRRRREEGKVVIMSKGGHPAFGEHYARPERYLSPEVVRGDIGESLERLGVGRIDLYLLHRDDRRVGVGEIVGMLNEEVGRGRIRYFGVSNWRVERIEEANRWAAGRGVMGFVASQPRWSLAEPSKPQEEEDVAARFLWAGDAAWHGRTGMAAFCYSPTAKGYFASGGERGKESYEERGVAGAAGAGAGVGRIPRGDGEPGGAGVDAGGEVSGDSAAGDDERGAFDRCAGGERGAVDAGGGEVATRRADG